MHPASLPVTLAETKTEEEIKTVILAQPLFDTLDAIRRLASTWTQLFEDDDGSYLLQATFSRKRLLDLLIRLNHCMMGHAVHCDVYTNDIAVVTLRFFVGSQVRDVERHVSFTEHGTELDYEFENRKRWTNRS